MDIESTALFGFISFPYWWDLVSLIALQQIDNLPMENYVGNIKNYVGN